MTGRSGNGSSVGGLDEVWVCLKKSKGRQGVFALRLLSGSEMLFAQSFVSAPFDRP